MDLTTCTVCASTDIGPAYTSSGYPIARCFSCGHLFVSKSVEQRILAEAYDEAYYGGAGRDPSAIGYADYLGKAEQRTEGFRTRLHHILRYTGAPGTILDFGCAVGLFVKVAMDEGWQAVGYERSKWAADYGRRILGVDIKVGTGDSDPFSPSSFDAVALWDVIEHVEFPRAIIERVRGWLKSGGIIALNTVNASSLGARLAGVSWRHLTPPHHLQFFSRRSLMRLLRDSGFKVLYVTTGGACFEGTDGGWIPTMLRRTDDLLCHWRLRPLVTSLNLLDEIELIAVKR